MDFASAVKTINKLLIEKQPHAIDDIECCPKISCWKGYDCLIQERIEGRIRRYRYSGSFIGYLFRTLENAGRGFWPFIAYSLNDSLYSGMQPTPTPTPNRFLTRCVCRAIRK